MSETRRRSFARLHTIILLVLDAVDQELEEA
jgi:hypothetical protein